MKERLKVEHLSVSFFTDEGEVQAVRDVSFSLNAGEVLAVVLKHKPTRRNENIISKKMLIRIFLNGIYISVIFMLQHFKNFLGAVPEEEATVLFTLFVLFQLFNAFNCRELDDTPMCKNLLKNKLMLGVFLLVLILQIIITQFGAAVFETVPLSVGMWGKMLLTAFTVIILNEVVKAVKRLFGRK